MSLMPNLKSIFKENLEAAKNNCPHGKVDHLCGQCISEKKGGEAFGKTLEDIANHHKVDIGELQKQLEKGISIEGEHGSNKEHARRIAMDHLWENPKYYTKLIGAGLEEPIEEDTVGAIGQSVNPSQNPQNPPNPQMQQQNTQQPQQDPKKVAEYQKKAAEFDKKIQMSITDQQKFTKQKNELDKKIQKLNLIQQKATKAKSDLAKKLGINQGT